MPQVTVQGFGRVNFPEGMAPLDIQSAIERDIVPIIQSRREAGQKDIERMADPLAGTSTSYKIAAGYGKAVPDILRGLGQTVGLVSREDVAEARKRDEPLMRTRAGMAGNVMGNLAALAPVAAIPGAGTLKGAAGISAALGAIAPSESTEETIGNIALSGLLGAGGHGIARGIGRSLSPRAAQIPEGFTVPPSQVKGAGIASRAAEGFAGKVTTAQKASVANQEIANLLARETLGLPQDAPLNLSTLNALRKQAGQAYESIKRVGAMNADDEFLTELNRIGAKYKGAEVDFPGLGKTPISDVIDSLKQQRFSSSGAVDAISILRDKADQAFRSGDKGLGRAFRESANAMEGVVERNLDSIASETGPLAKSAAQMLQDFRGARTAIAKTYSVEKALNEATGNVSLQALGQQFKKGKPLSGGLLTAGRFGAAFPKAAQRPEIIGSQPGISPLDIVGSGILGGAGVMASDDPRGGLAAILPFLRPGVRAGILSRPYQRMLQRPGMLSRLPGVAGNQQAIEEAVRRSVVPLAALGAQ